MAHVMCGHSAAGAPCMNRTPRVVVRGIATGIRTSWCCRDVFPNACFTESRCAATTPFERARRRAPAHSAQSDTAAQEVEASHFGRFRTDSSLERARGGSGAGGRAREEVDVAVVH